MTEANQTSGRPCWSDPESYGHTVSLPRRAWAWEFLRRNPDFRRDWADPAGAATEAAVSERMTVLRAGRAVDRLARWDVLFREVTRGRCPLGGRLLDPACVPARPAGNGRSRRACLWGPRLSAFGRPMPYHGSSLAERRAASVVP
ncbi:DUF6499 domain-containing protein [Thalassobaculum sp.]|uniref:transcriptional regulator domain-containing protein n=1 Tax=Thalassobaculum sp. TaxID=2022740 RepID=UPI0032EAAAE5